MSKTNTCQNKKNKKICQNKNQIKVDMAKNKNKKCINKNISFEKWQNKKNLPKCRKQKKNLSKSK